MVRLSILEAALLCRSRMFLGMAVVLVFLSVLAGFQGGAFAKEQAAAIAEARALELRQDMEARMRAERIRSGEIDPPWWQSPLNVQAWSYALVRHAALPPRPLAGIAVADADVRPFLFRINPHPPDRWSNRAPELTPAVAAYGGFDLTEVLLLLTPLLVIVALADVVRDRDGSERQRLAIVQAASERRLLMMRVLPRAAVVLAVVLLAALLGIVATRPTIDEATLADAATVLLAFLGYGGFWLLLLAALLLWLRRAVSIFSAVVVSWFVLGVLGPLLVDGLARLQSPPPSALAVFASERVAMVRARMEEDALTRAYAARDPLARDMLLSALEKEQLLITPTNLLIEMEVDRQRAVGRNGEAARTAAYLEAVERWSVLSPAALARHVIHRQAGRDLSRRRSFEEQVDAYHTALQETFTPLLMRRATSEEVLLPEPFRFEEPDSAR